MSLSNRGLSVNVSVVSGVNTSVIAQTSPVNVIGNIPVWSQPSGNYATPEWVSQNFAPSLKVYVAASPTTLQTYAETGLYYIYGLSNDLTIENPIRPISEGCKMMFKISGPQSYPLSFFFFFWGGGGGE